MKIDGVEILGIILKHSEVMTLLDSSVKSAVVENNFAALANRIAELIEVRYPDLN